MEENAVVIELSNGQEVELNEVWDCCDEENDCGSFVEVTDCETNELLARIKGTLPDFDDEDLNMDFFINFIETEISWGTGL